MRLEPTEKSILAYFLNHDDAERACRHLQENGYDRCRIDPMVSTPGRSVYSSSITTRIPSGPGNESVFPHPLAEADSFENGLSYSTGNPHPVYTHILTVVSPLSQAQKAEQILKKYAALL